MGRKASLNSSFSSCPESFEQLEEELFKQYLINEDRKPRTVLKHLWSYRLLKRECPSLNRIEIEAFLGRLKEKGRKNSYLNSILNTVKLYAHFKNLPELLEIRYRKDNFAIKATLSDEEIEAFLTLPPEQLKRRNWQTGKEFYAPANPRSYKKWTVFFSIMAFSGMRPGEVANLTVSDIDFGRGVFVIRDSKTNTPGVAPIAPNIIQTIKDYIGELKTDLLFASAQGGNKDGVTPVFDNVDWHYNFHKRINRLGVKRPGLTPYSLRHSYATRLLESDVSLFHVKKLMRHNDLRSTLVYEHLTTADLIKAVSKLPLVRRGTSPKQILQAIAQLIKTFKIEDDDRFNYRIEENENSVRFEVYIKCLLFFGFYSGIHGYLYNHGIYGIS